MKRALVAITRFFFADEHPRAVAGLEAPPLGKVLRRFLLLAAATARMYG